MTAQSDQSGPATAPRTPLTRGRVLRAAVALADEHGVDALSMRKLAREVGFEVMSLYNHVASKDDLLDGMVDLALEEIELPSHGAVTDWKAAVRTVAVSARAVLRRHVWVGSLWSSRWPGPARLRYGEALLRALHAGGLSPELVHRGFHALETHVLGYSLQEQTLSYDDTQLEAAAARFFEQVPAQEYPHFTEHVRQHLTEPAHDDGFGFVLDLILDGLERARDGG